MGDRRADGATAAALRHVSVGNGKQLDVQAQFDAQLAFQLHTDLEQSGIAYGKRNPMVD